MRSQAFLRVLSSEASTDSTVIYVFAMCSEPLGLDAMLVQWLVACRYVNSQSPDPG